MRSPFLYFAGGSLSGTELTAACLDGHLVAVGDAYMPADAVETASLRAGSLAALLGDTLAATHLSAAWIYGVVPEPPARHAVQRAVARRLHHVVDRRLVYRDPSVAPADLVALGGVFVTTPARTLADLARTTDPRSRATAQSWALADPKTAADGLAWFASHRGVPYVRSARALLATAQEELTR